MVIEVEPETEQIKKEAEALWAILSFFNHLLASVIKILFCVEAILDFCIIGKPQNTNKK